MSMSGFIHNFWIKVQFLKCIAVQVLIRWTSELSDTRIIWGNPNLSDMIDEGKVEAYIFIFSRLYGVRKTYHHPKGYTYHLPKEFS